MTAFQPWTVSFWHFPRRIVRKFLWIWLMLLTAEPCTIKFSSFVLKKALFLMALIVCDVITSNDVTKTRFLLWIKHNYFHDKYGGVYWSLDASPMEIPRSIHMKLSRLYVFSSFFRSPYSVSQSRNPADCLNYHHASCFTFILSNRGSASHTASIPNDEPWT